MIDSTGKFPRIFTSILVLFLPGILSGWGLMGLDAYNHIKTDVYYM